MLDIFRNSIYTKLYKSGRVRSWNASPTRSQLPSTVTVLVGFASEPIQTYHFNVQHQTLPRSSRFSVNKVMTRPLQLLIGICLNMMSNPELSKTTCFITVSPSNTSNYTYIYIYITHRIHVWYICLHLGILMVNVTIYIHI